MLDAPLLASTPSRSYQASFTVALASSSGCIVLVGRNFKHIVHRDKALLYNAVNMLRGYAGLDIRAPREVILYEEGL